MATSLPGLTPRAAQAMGRLMKTLPQDEREQCLLVVNWSGPSPASDLAPGIHIGGMKSEDIPREYIVEAYGVRVAYNFDPMTMRKFQGCVLDFMDDQFVFIAECPTRCSS